MSFYFEHGECDFLFPEVKWLLSINKYLFSQTNGEWKSERLSYVIALFTQIFW